MDGQQLQITLNGEPRELSPGTTVFRLLAEIAPGKGRCAVEINRQIVPRSTHEEHIVQDGDLIEIVTFVGGG